MAIFSLVYCAVTGVAAAAFVLAKSLSRDTERRRRGSETEPPTASPLIPIPFIGHLLGIIWYSVQYYTIISKKHASPILKIPIFGRTIYVARSPELMPIFHRLPRVVSLWFIEAKFTAQMGGMSDSTAKQMAENLGPGGDDKTTFTIEGLKVMHQVLGPKGGGLVEMNRDSAQILNARFNELSRTTPLEPIDLWDWVQHEITYAMTEAVYGSTNPYRDPKVEAGFWDFEGDVAKVILTGVLPNFIARKAIAGRETVVAAMRAYFDTGDWRQGSLLTRARYATMSGISTDDTARLETVNGIALLSNTVPTAFWTLHYIFSDPTLLGRIREQITSITSSEGAVRTIDFGRLKDAPLLFSVIYEAIRLRATGIGPRMILQDTVVGDEQYLLKKDSVLLIANRTLHFDGGAWGVNSQEFVPDRFVQKGPGGAFRGFGGGVNLCPGKALAMVEVAALVAMLTMRFDLIPVGGKWIEPGQDLTKVLQIAPPRDKVLVTFRCRQEAMNLSWKFEM
ncbi:cytochrome P450 [Lophiostoma macrostomum CBS 122681]|uniref:Cytochrome P450 n=1 Tax=Lophiostoma macrostomum CBS 122681 TaxID=1314788 RepID=A0A6A6T7V1_9PLEO|nr:cytochrome P450 [Lophiostoma macrostomum CBS 122681]